MNEVEKKEIERLKEENCSREDGKSAFVRKIQQQAIKEFAEKLTTHIFKYLGVKNIQEANKLSLIDSTLTYDVITDKINDLLKELSKE